MTAPECKRCHRPLRDEVSKQRRYGPKCFRREFGPSAPKPRSGTVRTAGSVRPVDHRPVDPNQIPLPLEDVVSIKQPRVFDEGTEFEPRDVRFLRTDDGEILQRIDQGRWLMTGAPGELDWNDAIEHAPLHEVITSHTGDQLRDIACGAIGDHVRETGDVRVSTGRLSSLTVDDLAVLETLILNANVTVNVDWPTADVEEGQGL